MGLLQFVPHTSTLQDLVQEQTGKQVLGEASAVHQQWVDRQGAGAKGGGGYQPYLEVLSKVRA